MSVNVRPKQGSLFCLAQDLTARRVLANVTISNGLAWSRDTRTLYFIDSATQSVWAFDYEVNTGNLGNRRQAIRIPKRDGAPDGMTIDADGMLWVAHWGGGRITRWNPKTGRLLRTCRLPISLVTSCAFGGPNLDELFITSARDSLTPQQLARESLAGGLFRMRPGVTGLADRSFAG
jgi:sugar lactone lactonase YvrE